MRKEIVIAIILGLLLGGVIIYGAQLANQSAQKARNNRETANPLSVESPTPIPTPTAAVIINFPSDHAVIFTNTVTITGNTPPNAAVIVSDSEDDVLTAADSSGQFSATVKLTGGENKITITSLSGDKLDSASLTLIYTTAKIITPTPNPIDSPIASSSQEIVNKTKEEILKKAQDQFKQTEANLNTKSNIAQLVGYKGTINDIAQNAFTILSNNLSLQISFGPTTSIIKDGRLTKPELLSIKDEVIIIGNLVSNGVLDAKRIVVFKESSPEPVKRIVFSLINKVNLKSKTLSITLGNKEQILTLGKKLKLDITTLLPGQKLFGVILLPDDPKDPATLLLAKIF